jgi:eukaryotic-like serine/threonine-protein kinase
MPTPHSAAAAGSERDGLGPGEADERASSWDFDEGAEIGHGRTVVRMLGGGKRFEVFLVWDDALYALAVAKVVRPHLAAEAGVLRDLVEEAEALDRLAHPVVVRAFDVVAEGPHPHLLIEHLEGPTLRKLIRRGGPMPLEQLLPLAAHVGAALHYMAGQEMVHLDIKPDNIVMGVPPRVIDLSIARTLERASQVRRPIGTDAYMAPEQCLPRDYPGEIGPPTDVWGLGATLHHAVSGSVPFPRAKGARRSHDPLVRFPQLEREPRDLPGSAPLELRELIGGCLAPRPDERITPEQLVSGLDPLVQRLPRKLVFGRRSVRAR